MIEIAIIEMAVVKVLPVRNASPINLSPTRLSLSFRAERDCPPYGQSCGVENPALDFKLSVLNRAK
jgi:hypothetical protein